MTPNDHRDPDPENFRRGKPDIWRGSLPSVSATVPTPSITTRLARLLGFGDRPIQQTLAGAAALRLSNEPLQAPEPGIFWDDGLPLQRLHELPRSALSGPIQEDKALAHAALVALIGKDVQHHAAFDLRRVDGLCTRNVFGEPCPTFEALAARPACRSIRIISYKDFQRTISTALPGFKAGTTMELRQASWLGERLFWNGEQHVEAFACAIAYARLRGLDVSLPCNLTRYWLETRGLAAMEARYHVLAMPATAWHDSTFMNLLVSDQTPYARLRLGVHELLILEKRQPKADALGQGLKLAGAADFIAHLQRLADRTPPSDTH